eukprot:1158900-Pyramimonas_sp.AAC.1
MTYTINALLISNVNPCEEQFSNRTERSMTDFQRQANASEHITKIAEAMQFARNTRAGGGGSKPVSEYEAVQHFEKHHRATGPSSGNGRAVSYTHLRAHETGAYL